MREHWYADGPLTEQIVNALNQHADDMGVGTTIIANEHGVYVANVGAIPGEGEWHFEDSRNASAPFPRAMPPL